MTPGSPVVRARYGFETTTAAWVPFHGVPDLVTPVTVKVSEVAVSFTEVDTEQVPTVLVVHVLVPEVPPESVTVTLAPETAAPEDVSVTDTVAFAVHDLLPVVAEPVMVAPVVTTGDGGVETRRV